MGNASFRKSDVGADHKQAKIKLPGSILRVHYNMPEVKTESRKLQSGDFCTGYIGSITVAVSDPQWRKYPEKRGLRS